MISSLGSTIKLIIMYKLKFQTRKTSILIPVGRFSFFVDACLRNILETCGDKNKIRVVFLVSNSVEEHIAKRLNSLNSYCDVVTAPFASNSNHLKLLDWAVREVNISNWFITQHCDLFWTNNNWLKIFHEHMNSKNDVVCPWNWSNYSLDGNRMHTTGDFLAAYNRKNLVRENLKFEWGHLNQSCQVSEKVKNKIVEQKIIKVSTGQPVTDGEWMDGSQAMTWEFYSKTPERIKILEFNSYYNHLLSIFRVADMTNWTENTIEINYDWAPFGSDLWLKIFTAYSYLTTFLLDEREVKDIVLPWNFYLQVLKQFNLNVEPYLKDLVFLDKYKGKYNTVGIKNHNIESIRFGEVMVPLKQKRFKSSKDLI